MAALLDSSMNPDPSTSSPAIPSGARRASDGMAGATARPDPEVVAIARRRQFSVGQKRALLAEADRCKAAGTLGGFLRSERIYSSRRSRHCCPGTSATRCARPAAPPEAATAATLILARRVRVPCLATGPSSPSSLAVPPYAITPSPARTGIPECLRIRNARGGFSPDRASAARQPRSLAA